MILFDSSYAFSSPLSSPWQRVADKALLARIRRMMKKGTQREGRTIQGDPTSRISTPSQFRLPLIGPTWSKMVITTVRSGGEPFFAGFKIDGHVEIYKYPLTGKGLRLRLGQKDLLLFAIDKQEKFLPITGCLVAPRLQSVYPNDEFPRL